MSSDEEASVIIEEEFKASTSLKASPLKKEGDYLLHRADRLRKRRTFIQSTKTQLPFDQLQTIIKDLQLNLLSFDADNTTLILKQAKLQRDLSKYDVFDTLMSRVTHPLL